MRTRGSYRITNTCNGMIKKANVNIIEDSDKEVIVIIEENRIVKRPKSDPQNVITIESDDDIEEDIKMTDMGIDSRLDSTVSVIEEKRLRKVRPLLKKCGLCFRQLPNDTKDYKYNHLTSADFYNNPRIHPSVISIELKDRTRFNCFEESINRNRDLFKDKTVLIVGSGTGLLALLVGRAKARNVLIFDRAGILDIIETVIEKNKCRLANQRTKFFVIRQSIEEYVLPNGLTKVDIIVSDWTNHSLFLKSLIIPFIEARNKWLCKGGLIFPDSVHLYLAGAHDYIHRHTAKDKRHSHSLYIKRIDYWDKNIYGFDMTSVRHRVLSEPLHEYVNKSQVITNEYLIKAYNLCELSVEDINFCLPFELKAIKDHYLQTYVVFFDVIFSKCLSVPLMYSTRPTAYKHMFRPTVLFIESEKQLTLYKNEKIKGLFKYSLSSDLNQMSINVDFKFKNAYFDVDEQLFYTTN